MNINNYVIASELSSSTIIAGGLMLEGNPWVCDSRLLQLSKWLRRWLREQLNNGKLHSVIELQKATCVHSKSGRVSSIFNLQPENVLQLDQNVASNQTSHRIIIIIFYIIMYPCFVQV